jgi:hypothetical protein
MNDTLSAERLVAKCNQNGVAIGIDIPGDVPMAVHQGGIAYTLTRDEDGMKGTVIGLEHAFELLELLTSPIVKGFCCDCPGGVKHE